MVYFSILWIYFNIIPLKANKITCDSLKQCRTLNRDLLCSEGICKCPDSRVWNNKECVSDNSKWVVVGCIFALIGIGAAIFISFYIWTKKMNQFNKNKTSQKYHKRNVKTETIKDKSLHQLQVIPEIKLSTGPQKLDIHQNKEEELKKAMEMLMARPTPSENLKFHSEPVSRSNSYLNIKRPDSASRVIGSPYLTRKSETPYKPFDFEDFFFNQNVLRKDSNNPENSMAEDELPDAKPELEEIELADTVLSPRNSIEERLDEKIKSKRTILDRASAKKNREIKNRRSSSISTTSTKSNEPLMDQIMKERSMKNIPRRPESSKVPKVKSVKKRLGNKSDIEKQIALEVCTEEVTKRAHEEMQKELNKLDTEDIKSILKKGPQSSNTKTVQIYTKSKNREDLHVYATVKCMN